jgi:cold shock protein
MTTGRILQFDEMRGYGFIAADDGGDDVFLHASVFAGDPGELVPGARVEFQIMAGDRGRKAFAAHLAGGPHPPPARTEPDTHDDPTPRTLGDEGTCDVLSRAEFGQEITELLLDAAPGMTGGQIVQVRQGLTELAAKHGWVGT